MLSTTLIDAPPPGQCKDMNKLFKHHPSSIATALILVVTTIGLASTTNFSRSIIEPARILAGAGAILFTIIAIGRGFAQKSINFTSIFILLLIISYGLLLSFLNGSFYIAEYNIIDNLLIITLFTITLSMHKGAILSERYSKYIFSVSLITFLITLSIGGFIIDYPPRFVFEYYSSSINSFSDQVYSQGISKFYGLSAIISAFLWARSQKNSVKIFYGSLSILFLALSILGGARGDVVAAIAVVILIIFNASFLSFLAFTLITLIAIFNFPGTDSINDIVFFARMERLSTSFGMRDILLDQAFYLLSQEKYCLFIGCGFGFFQAYYGYDVGVYPHNVPVEMVISLGLPITIIIFTAHFIGLKRYLKDNYQNGDVFIYVYLYFFLIFLKSDTFLSSWILVASLAAFSSRALVGRRD